MTDPSRPVVFYHYPCQDGFAAAWACWLKNPDWEYVPARYGFLPDTDIHGRIVYFLDISYKRKDMIEMARKASVIQVIDHHKTSLEELYDMPSNLMFKYDSEKSGAGLAWEVFHKDEPAPPIIGYVQDRDLWLFNFAATKPITEYLFSIEHKFYAWSRVSKELLDTKGMINLIDQGLTLLRNKKKQAEDMIKYKFRLSIYDQEVWAVNAPYMFIGDLSDMMTENEPFVVLFWYDGMKTIFSLRSSSDQSDVSVIAKHYGGGGHAHAAGFEIEGLGFHVDHPMIPIFQVL